MNKELFDISIIIPMHNNMHELAICLDSILLQNSPLSVECIVVDDGSSDSSLVLAHSYEQRFVNVKVISQANAGAGSARNNGMNTASGRYIWFVDADDYITNNALQIIHTSMSTNGDIDVFVFSRSKFFVDANKIEPFSGRLRNIFFHPSIEGNIITIEDRPRITSAIFLPLHFLLFRHAFVRENSLRCSETMVMNDTFMALAALCCARKILTCNKVIYVYCRRDNSTTSYVSQIHDERRFVVMSVLDSCEHMIKNQSLSPAVLRYFYITKIVLLAWTIDLLTPDIRYSVESYTQNFLLSLSTKQFFQLYHDIPKSYNVLVNKQFQNIFRKKFFPYCPTRFMSILFFITVFIVKKIHMPLKRYISSFHTEISK